MTGNSPNLLTRARQGDPDAIANLLSRSLSRQGITITVERRGDTLSILLQSEVLPDIRWVDQVIQSLIRLQPAQITTVEVYGQQSDSLIPDWSETITLPTVPGSAPPSESGLPRGSASSTRTTASPQSSPGTVQQSYPIPARSREQGRLLRLIVVAAAIYVVWPLVSATANLPLSSANNLSLLLIFLVLRPMALQEGAVVMTRYWVRPSYWHALGVFFLAGLAMGSASWLGRPLFSENWVAVGTLLFLVEALVYGVILKAAPSDDTKSLGFERACGVVLLMYGVVLLPGVIAVKLFEDFLAIL